MKKDLNIKKIGAKFQELIALDEDYEANAEQEREEKAAQLASLLSLSIDRGEKREEPAGPAEPEQRKSAPDNEELIFTKSDICREVAKLKPYLRHFGETKTSVQIEDKSNKKISDEEQNSLSELVIYLNKELCERLRGGEAERGLSLKRQCREKEGWVYEVFYRFAPPEEAPALLKTGFRNGYAVLTDMLELFSNLTFEEELLRVNINEVRRVKYFEEREYLVIDIRFKEGALHVAFLNESQMKLFDRMLFLLKNMARTSSTRLFQNQLLKNIYSEY